jgi:hypothetical protein
VLAPFTVEVVAEVAIVDLVKQVFGLGGLGGK